MARRTFLGLALTLPAMARAQTPEMQLRLRCKFAGQDFGCSPIDTATTRDLISILPVALAIENLSNTEKIAHLPHRHDEGGLVDFDDKAPGDLCYFRGWGSLALFQADYAYLGDLIRPGRIEGSNGPLLVPGTHALRLDLV